MSEDEVTRRHARAVVLLMAVACGLSAANLYYAQPILDTLSHFLHTDVATTGLVVTLAQIGYAIGLAFVVPLGDLYSRRRLAPAVLSLAVVGLVASALAPSVGVLIVVALLVGTGSVAAQLLVPLAATLAPDGQAGRAVGTVMSGLLTGILLARTVSGLIAGVSSWRMVYAVAAVLSAGIAVTLWWRLPHEAPRVHLRYRHLLSSGVRLFRDEQLLQIRALYGALGFASFSVFWTTMAYLFARPPFHYGDVTIGLFGLIGAGGALCASFAGRWVDRGWSRSTTRVFAAFMVGSFVVMWEGRHSLGWMIAGILLLDLGAQGMQVTNQSLVFAIAPELRSRIASVYMVCYFAGGAAGSASGAAIYASHGWSGTCVLGAAIGGLALAMALAGLGGRRASHLDEPRLIGLASSSRD